MAKSKPLAKDESKRLTSNSTVHKNGKLRKPRRGINHREEKTKSFPKRLNKAAAEQRLKKKAEDPLAAAFTGFFLNKPSKPLAD